MYGGFGGSNECRYELMRWTNVVLPEPAMPMVIITLGFCFEGPGTASNEDDEAMSTRFGSK